jgi:hypothetical protein
LPKVLWRTLAALRMISRGLRPLRKLSLWKVSTLTGTGVGAEAAGAVAAAIHTIAASEAIKLERTFIVIADWHLYFS